MAKTDWRRLFGDEGEFNDWFESFRARLIATVILKFGLPPELAEDIVGEAIGRCLDRPQPANLKHLQGALVLAVGYVAHERIRARSSPHEDADDAITAQPVGVQSVRQADELPDGCPTGEDLVVGHEAAAVLWAELAALQEHLRTAIDGDRANADVLKVLEIIVQEGEELKRSEMIAKTLLGGDAYDRARKRLSRAAVRKEVVKRAQQRWIIKRFEKDEVARLVLSGGLPVNGGPTEAECAKARHRIERAREAFNRDFAIFTERMTSPK